MLRIGVVAVLLLALLHGSTSRSTLVYASADDRAIALVRSVIEKMGWPIRNAEFSGANWTLRLT
jgi:hypothetical protein